MRSERADGDGAHAPSGAAEPLCAAANSALLAGDLWRAADLLTEAGTVAANDQGRTQVLCLRARLALVTGDGSAPAAELRVAADALRGARPDLAARLLLEAVLPMLADRDPDTLAVALQAHADLQGADPITRAQADAALGLAYAFSGDRQAAGRYLPDGGRMARPGGDAQQMAHVVRHLVLGLSALERYTESMALCRHYVAAVRSIGAEGLLPVMLCLLAGTAYFTAEFDAMEMAANEALTLAHVQGQDAVAVWARTCLAQVLSVRGKREPARLQADAAVADAGRTGTQALVPAATAALALSDLATGDWSAASRRYRQVRSALSDGSSGLMHWRADEIEALWRNGERDAARDLLAELQASTPGEGPWEQAAAARMTALLAGDEADALFAEALRRHESCASSFERARTRLCWGEWLARAGRAAPAAEHLSAARAQFARLGARQWAERAQGLLRALGPDAAAGTTAPAAGHEPGVGEAVGGEAVGTIVRALGPLTLVQGGNETPVGLDAPGRALRYLVTCGGSVRVDQLIDTLWPDADAEAGRIRLRTLLSRARGRYGPVLTRDGEVVRWSDDVSVDAHRFDRLARTVLVGERGEDSARLAREAIALYSDDLLPLARYAEWAVTARERLRQRYLDLLALLADDAAERDDLPAAIGYARDIVETDPLDESGYVRLARLHLDAGHSGPARETLAAAKDAVATLGLPMSAELARVARRVSCVAASGA